MLHYHTEKIYQNQLFLIKGELDYIVRQEEKKESSLTMLRCTLLTTCEPAREVQSSGRLPCKPQVRALGHTFR